MRKRPDYYDRADPETRATLCPVCRGRGWRYDAGRLGGESTCATCQGSGKRQ